MLHILQFKDWSYKALAGLSRGPIHLNCLVKSKTKRSTFGVSWMISVNSEYPKGSLANLRMMFRGELVDMTLKSGLVSFPKNNKTLEMDHVIFSIGNHVLLSERNLFFSVVPQEHHYSERDPDRVQSSPQWSGVTQLLFFSMELPRSKIRFSFDLRNG